MSKVKETSKNYENKQAITNECSQVYAINVIGGQWTLAICCYLLDGKLRFGELRKCLPKITERMLTLQLRKLEELKIVKRTVYAEVPPRVEYELTCLGYELKSVMDQLSIWGDKHKCS